MSLEDILKIKQEKKEVKQKTETETKIKKKKVEEEVDDSKWLSIHNDFLFTRVF